jgi:RecA-family ATPase
VSNLENIAAMEDVDTTTASDIESCPVSWLFEPYLPMGTVTIIIGDGGEGKSFASLALAAAVTRGIPLFGPFNRRAFALC